MTSQQIAVLNALVTFAAENIPGGLSEDEREVARIVGDAALRSTSLIKKLEEMWGGTNDHEYMLLDAQLYDENYSGATLVGWRVIADIRSKGMLLLERPK